MNLRLFKTQDEARRSHVRGVEALLMLKFAKDLKFMERHLALPVEYQRTALYFGGKAAFEKLLLDALRMDVFRKNIRSEEEFKSYGETVVRSLFERAQVLWGAVKPVLDAYQSLRATLYVIEQAQRRATRPSWPCAPRSGPSSSGSSRPISWSGSGSTAWPRLARYIEALGLRAERAQNDPEKDRRKAAQAEVVRPGAGEARRGGSIPDSSPEKRDAVEEFRWLVEELKISLFAPEIKTAVPVSPQTAPAQAERDRGAGLKRGKHERPIVKRGVPDALRRRRPRCRRGRRGPRPPSASNSPSRPCARLPSFETTYVHRYPPQVYGMTLVSGRLRADGRGSKAASVIGLAFGAADLRRGPFRHPLLDGRDSRPRSRGTTPDRVLDDLHRHAAAGLRSPRIFGHLGRTRSRRRKGT